MPIVTPPIVALALALLAIYTLLRHLRRERAFRAFARTHGCQPARQSSHSLPLGIDIIWRIIRMPASGEDLLDNIIAPRLRETGYTSGRRGLFGTRMVVTAEPANIHALLVASFADFEIGQLRFKQFRPFLGSSIFSVDGKAWAHSRGLLKPTFARVRMGDLRGLEGAVADLLRVLRERCCACGDGKDGDGGEGDLWTGEVDMMDLAYRFTLDAATDFLFGQSVGSQLAALNRKNERGIPSHLTHPSRPGCVSMSKSEEEGDISFSEAFAIAQEVLLSRVRMQSLYWMINPSRFRKAVKVVQRFADRYVRLALERAARHGNENAKLGLTGEDADEEARDGRVRNDALLDTLANGIRDPTELRDQILGILVAGRDSTASLLSWTIFLLAKNPAILAELRSHILADFGYHHEPLQHDTDDTDQQSANASATSTLSANALKQCTYLQHVLLETLRLHPIIPMNSRVAVRNTILPTGGGPDGSCPVAVRKGTLVNFSVYVMQRREDIWGADSDQFRPERWMGRKVDSSFMPFGAGPRVCIGQQYAMAEAGYVLVRLLQNYDAIDGSGLPATASKSLGLVMSPQNGVKVRLRKCRKET